MWSASISSYAQMRVASIPPIPDAHRGQFEMPRVFAMAVCRSYACRDKVDIRACNPFHFVVIIKDKAMPGREESLFPKVRDKI